MLIILRKILFLLISNLIHFDAIARLLLMILVLFVFVFVQIKVQPFFTQVLNDIEYRSLTAILATAFFSLIYHFKQDDLTRVLTSILILLANIYFLYILFIQILSTHYEEIVIMLRSFPGLQKFVINIKKEFDLIEEEYIKKSNSSSKRLTATDKVRLSISKAMRRISQVIGNQKRSIEKRLSKMVQNFNQSRPSFNKT